MLLIALCWLLLWKTAVGERQGVQISVLPRFILSASPCSPAFPAQEQVLEGLSTQMLLKILIQKPQCSEKTGSNPSTQSTQSRASCVMRASTREEGFLQQTEPLVMKLKYPLKMYLDQRQHPLEFSHWEGGVECLKLIQCYAVCIF